ncbi:hypothetical protein YH69_24635 [Pseudomonas aeruginosa]|nr:hypothetical protein YH69_24635 [Pseudomonas aeruginosa]
MCGCGRIVGPNEADLPRLVIGVQCPGRASEGQQGVTQGHGSQALMSQGQRQGIEITGRGIGIAQPIATALENVEQAIPHTGVCVGWQGDIHQLQQQIALCRRRCELHQGVASLSDHRNVLGGLLG